MNIFSTRSDFFRAKELNGQCNYKDVFTCTPNERGMLAEYFYAEVERLGAERQGDKSLTH